MRYIHTYINLYYSSTPPSSIGASAGLVWDPHVSGMLACDSPIPAQNGENGRGKSEAVGSLRHYRYRRQPHFSTQMYDMSIMSSTIHAAITALPRNFCQTA